MKSALLKNSPPLPSFFLLYVCVCLLLCVVVKHFENPLFVISFRFNNLHSALYTF